MADDAGRFGEGEVFATGAEAEVGVKIAGGVWGVIAGGKDEEVLVWGENSAAWKGPQGAVCRVVGEVVAGDVEGEEVAVVDFDPVGGVAVAIVEAGVAG